MRKSPEFGAIIWKLSSVRYENFFHLLFSFFRIKCQSPHHKYKHEKSTYIHYTYGAHTPIKCIFVNRQKESTFLNLTVSLMRCDACTLFYSATYKFERIFLCYLFIYAQRERETESAREREGERMNILVMRCSAFDLCDFSDYSTVYREIRMFLFSFQVLFISCGFFFISPIFLCYFFDVCFFTILTHTHVIKYNGMFIHLGSIVFLLVR